MTTPLIEAIKHIREQKSKRDKILVQNVEWDLDPNFIGEPMTPRVLKRLSQYVDKKLVDYSSIQGSEAATNMPRATLSYNEPDPLKLPPTNENIGKDFSYVTSYNIEHQTMKVKARIITAPASYKLEDELWFELCCSDGKGTSVKDVIKDTVKANLCIITPTRGKLIAKNIKASEKTALETLRDMITEKEFRNYLRYGFIVVKGSSGRLYQVFRDNLHTKVWEQGILVEEVCVRIKLDTAVPDSDNVIAFKTMIETDENLFKSLGNVYKMIEKKVA